VTLANSHRSYEVLPVRPENFVEVQKIADTFFAEGALPKNIKASDAQIWSPDKQAFAK
jgi:sulfonate transport system substrate-binding protein